MMAEEPSGTGATPPNKNKKQRGGESTLAENREILQQQDIFFYRYTGVVLTDVKEEKNTEYRDETSLVAGVNMFQVFICK